jgi:tight adherence protein C
VTPALVAASVLLAFASAWQLAAERGEEIGRAARRAAARLTAGRVRSLGEATLALGVTERIARAGLEGRVGPAAILAGKGAGVLLGLGCGAMAAPAMPGRLAAPAIVALGAAGFLGPDALLERAARLRTIRLVAALPDALDMLAVGIAAGRAPIGVMAEIATQGDGALARELAVVVAGIEAGEAQHEALALLRERVAGGEVAALTRAIERSGRHGSPLAEQLHQQARELRRVASRRLEERASRAAPKIQLVIALVLVPSVLLMILAAIIAHSDALFGAVH